MLVIAGNL